MPPAEDKRLVALEGVVKRYESVEGGASQEVLRGVDLELAPGRSTAITGPSGSGKSTLLHIVGTLDRPSAGRVSWKGQDLGTKTSDELARFRNGEIGFVFQSHHLLPQCTALENVLVPTLVLENRAARDAAVERARELLSFVGLAERESHRPGQLSGGECQRVAVVRALINRPQLVLADEPTGSLDAKAAEDLADLLARLGDKESIALLSVTHSARFAARMDRVFRLEDGKLVDGAVERVP